MIPSLVIGGIPFFDAPSKIEGSPYWVDLWTDVNGYKIGLQIKPSTYKSANLSIYMGKAKASEEKGHKEFLRDFGGKVFIITPVQDCCRKEFAVKDATQRVKTAGKADFPMLPAIALHDHS